MKRTWTGVVIAVSALVCFWMMYKGVYIPGPKLMLSVSAVLFIMFFISKVRSIKHPVFSSLVLFGMLLCLAMAAGSAMQEWWTFDAIFSADGMMRITLILTGTAAVVMSLFYALAQTAVKKRPLNQIPSAGKKKLLPFSQKKRQQHVSITLGYSAKSRN